MRNSDSSEPHLTAKQLQAALKFLSTAPPAAAEWTVWHSERLVRKYEGEAAAPTEPETEDDDFYNDMEGEDDVLHRRRLKPIDSHEPPAPAKQRVPTGAKILLAAVLVIGVVVGIWFAGKPGGEPVDAGPAMGTQTAPGGAEMQLRQSELEALLADSPQDLDARLELGVLYFNQMMVPQAIEQWEAVVEVEPDNVTAWYNLGFAYLSADPPEAGAAEAAWAKVLELEPESELASTVSMHLEGLQDESTDQ